VTAEHLTFAAPVEPSTSSGVMAGQAPIRTATPIDTTDLRILERAAIQRALEEARHKKTQAARSPGLTRKQLYVRLRQHGLES
jgi:DNA-binding NtrC family response regulator